MPPGCGWIRTWRLLPFLLAFLLLSWSGALGQRCTEVAEEALKVFQPRWGVELKARAKAGADTGGLEPASGAWVVLEVPLYSRRERLETLRLKLRRKKEILRAIARLQLAIRRLKFLSDLGVTQLLQGLW